MKAARAIRLTVFAAAALALPLSGCGTTAEPAVRTVRVEVPVAVPCAADPGPDPAFVDTAEALRAAGDIFDKVRLLLAGRDQRDARLAELGAAVAGCRK